MTRHTVETDFGALHIERVNHVDLADSDLVTHAHRTVYAVTGRNIAGHLSIDPAFGDVPSTLHLPVEFAAEPTSFAVSCGVVGSRRTSEGKRNRHDGILTVDGCEVLLTRMTINRTFDHTEFTVNHRIGPSMAKAAPALATAKTHQVIHAILQVHLADVEHAKRMERLYTQHTALRRRRDVAFELEGVESEIAKLTKRAGQLREFLDRLDTLQAEAAHMALDA